MFFLKHSVYNKFKFSYCVRLSMIVSDSIFFKAIKFGVIILSSTGSMCVRELKNSKILGEAQPHHYNIVNVVSGIENTHKSRSRGKPGRTIYK